MVDLFGHNKEAFQEINKMIESGRKRIEVYKCKSCCG